MSKQDQDCMRQWANEHGKAVRQLSVRQNNTKHAAETCIEKSYLLATKSLKSPVRLMILVTSCQSMILTPATMKTVLPRLYPRRRRVRGCFSKVPIKEQDDRSRCQIALLHHTGVKKPKSTRKFNRSVEKANLHVTIKS